MSNELEAPQPSRTPVVRKALAGVVLVIVAALAVKVVIGLILSVFWVIIGVAAVIAVLWALKTIVW
jgi:hypothetical protein